MISPQPVKQKKSGIRSSEADIKSEEIQEMTEIMGELLQKTAGCDLKFHLTFAWNLPEISKTQRNWKKSMRF